MINYNNNNKSIIKYTEALYQTTASAEGCDPLQLEAGLSYALPPRQYQPLRHCQAHVFERLRRPDAAEAAARDALRLQPDNAWALYALKGSLEKQGGSEEEVKALANAIGTAWQNGDRPLNCPCPMFVIF